MSFYSVNALATRPPVAGAAAGARAARAAPPRVPEPRAGPGHVAGDPGVPPGGAGPELRRRGSRYTFLSQTLGLCAAQLPNGAAFFRRPRVEGIGVLGRQKCLVYENHKSLARHPYVVSNKPQSKRRACRGAPGGLEDAAGSPDDTRPRPQGNGGEGSTFDTDGGLACQSSAILNDSNVSRSVLSAGLNPLPARLPAGRLAPGESERVSLHLPVVTTCTSAARLGAPGAWRGTPRGYRRWGQGTSRGH